MPGTTATPLSAPSRQLGLATRPQSDMLLAAFDVTVRNLRGMATLLQTLPRYFTKPCGVNVLAWFECVCRIDEWYRLGGFAKLDRT